MVGDGHLHRSVVREGHHAEGVGRTAGGLEGADRLLLLRGICAQGLALMAHPDALTECVTLLVDKWIPARVGAIRAIANAGLPAGELLLRLKALAGDEEDEVTAECFAALLRLAPTSSLEFVAKFLRSSSEALAESAALVMGESRLAAAFQFLRNAWERIANAPLRRTL